MFCGLFFLLVEILLPPVRGVNAVVVALGEADILRQGKNFHPRELLLDIGDAAIRAAIVHQDGFEILAWIALRGDRLETCLEELLAVPIEDDEGEFWFCHAQCSSGGIPRN